MHKRVWNLFILYDYVKCNCVGEDNDGLKFRRLQNQHKSILTLKYNICILGIQLDTVIFDDVNKRKIYTAKLNILFNVQSLWSVDFAILNVRNFNERKMTSRKSSRNGFDYAAASYSDPRYARTTGGGYATVGHYGGYAAYPYTQQPYYGYPSHPAYNAAYASG